MESLNENTILNVGLYIFSALVTLFLLIGVVTDSERKNVFIKSFIVLLISNIFMQLGEAEICFFEGSPENILILKISAFMSLAFSYVLIGSYVYCLASFVKDKISVPNTFIYTMIGICFIFILLSLCDGLFISFDEGGNLVYGPYYWLVRVFDMISAIIETLCVIKFSKVLRIRDTLFLLSFSVLPLLISIALQFLWYPAPEYIAITLSLIVIYILFHGETARQLAENHIALMLSQIQPHFLHNTINVIRELCYENPMLARDALYDFSSYLRANMDSLNTKGLIPFSKELVHIEAYIRLEKLRFGDRLNIVYDIQEKDFLLPSLTVQPIVENAIKYGICNKEKGGTLTLKTYKEENCIIIKIIDDGKGFDVENPIKKDGRSHIGISNVRNRLKQITKGNLIIESSPEKGTTATIIIEQKKHKGAEK